MIVKLSEITDAIDFTDQYTEYFLDKETGEIVYVNDMMMTSSEKEPIYDLLDEHGFFRLPDQRWYAFEEDAHKRIAIRWCEENGLEWE